MKYLLLVLTLACCAPVFSAPVEHDLGEGLHYLRAKALPADLPDDRVANGAMVLDLRYASADAAAGSAFEAWLAFQAGKRPLLLILANAETAAPLLAALDANQDETGVITLGSPDSNFAPDFVLTPTKEEERTAYEALEKGTPIAKLVTPDIMKRRTDEAFIVANRNGPISDESDDRHDEKPGNAPAPVSDVVLQRAVQLHRALLALKKLPAGQP